MYELTKSPLCGSPVNRAIGQLISGARMGTGKGKPRYPPYQTARTMAMLSNHSESGTTASTAGGKTQGAMAGASPKEKADAVAISCKRNARDTNR